MSEELNQTETTPVESVPAMLAAVGEAVKRPRGRPKGSKNKPKPEGYVAPPRKKRAATEAAPAVSKQVVTHTAKVVAFVAPTEDTDNVVESTVETADILE